MKFKTKTRTVEGTYTRDGVTIPRARTEKIDVPVLPRDWQTIALRGAITLVVMLTLVAVVWSTYSIGTLLGGGVGFAAAIVFDASWAVVLVLSYLSRYDDAKREFPDKLGWVLLAVTMIAIGWEGADRGAWGMAVVGALVSFVAKILWLGVMQHVNADLSDDDRAWVTAVTSDVQTKAAVAQVRRTAAMAENRATMQLLAMERELADVRASLGLETPAIETAEVIEPDPVPVLAGADKPQTIRTLAGEYPDLSAGAIAALMTRAGTETTEDEVRSILAVRIRTR